MQHRHRLTRGDTMGYFRFRKTFGVLPGVKINI